MKKIASVLITAIVMFCLCACSGTSLAGASGGIETEKGWMDWSLDGNAVNEKTTIACEEGDSIKVKIELTKGTVHATVTNETGDVLYDQETDKDNTAIDVDTAGNYNLSYETSDAVGKITMYRFGGK